MRRADFRATPPARRRGRFPRWLKVVLVAGALAIVAGVIAPSILNARTVRVTPADIDATGRLHSAQVVSGMCLEGLGDEAGVVVVVACDQSHSAEVASSYEFSGSEYPGDAAVARTALDYCASQLAPGAPLASTAEGRDWVAWVPSVGTWNAGDRSGLCIVTGAEPWEGAATSR